MEAKTLKDAVWQIMDNPAGVVAKIELDNGYEISVAMNRATYGGNTGMWEICVFKKGGWESIELDSLSGGTVDGWIPFRELDEKIEKIQKELAEKWARKEA